MTKFLLPAMCVFFTLISFVSQAQNTGTITGHVIDNKGNPVAFATVVVHKSNQGTVTNAKGWFKLERVDTGTQKIHISAVGFNTTQKSVVVAANKVTKVRFECSQNVLELKVVTVTAQKREEDLQKVPVAVTSINAEKVENLQISGLNEVGRVAPNFKSYDDGGSLYPMIATRGIFTVDDTPIVGVYIDDVPLFNTSSFPSLLNDVERMEVLRGPQGTIYGRNTLGGAINIITRKPTNQTKGFIAAGYGNLNQLKINGGLSIPLIKNKLFTRISGSYTTRNGYIENTFLNTNNLLARKLGAGNVKFVFYPDDHWTISLTSGLEYREVNAYAFVGGFGPIGNTLDSLKQNAPYKLSYNTQGGYYTLSSNNALKVGYQAPTFSVTSVTSYQRTNIETRNDEYDFTQFDLNSLPKLDRSMQTIAEEIRLNSNNKDSRFEWLAGIFAYYVSREVDQQIESGTANAANAPTPAVAALYPFISIDLSNISQLGMSAFANATYSLTRQLKLVAGLRYEIEQNNTSINRSYRKGTDASFTFPPLGLLPKQFEKTATYSAISPKIGLSCELTPQVMAYANAARGYRPGGINPFTTDENTAVFNPEFSWNYELGLKTTLWNKRLRANLTGFYIDYQDQQLYTLIDFTTFNFGRDNIGRSISYGIELETEWILTKGLNATVNVGYLETEITDYKVRGLTGEINNKGNKQGYSPQWNGNVGLDYQKRISDIKLGISLDYQFQSDIFFDPENTLKQTAYGILNARVSVAYKMLTLEVWGKNLNNEVYYSYGYGISGAGGFASFGLPRIFGTSLTARF